MKKIFQIFSLLFISSLMANAQSNDPVFHFGLKATPNFSWLKSDDVSSDGSRLGFAYGLVTEFRFADNYAFATGIDIAYRGGKTKSESSVTMGDTVISTISKDELKLQYLEIPLTLKLKTNEIGYLRYYLQVGVAPGINIRARGDNKSTVQTKIGSGSPATLSSEAENKDIKKDINNVSMSMIISGGVEYNVSGNTNLFAGIIFNNGFLDIADGKQSKVISNYLGLNIGVLF